MAKKEKFDSDTFISPVGHPRDRIRIHESAEMPKGGIFMSLNGYAFLAKPEEEIDLPRPVRLMLDTLIRTETTRVDDGNGKMITNSRNIRRITYTLIKEDVDKLPDPAVIDSSAGKADSKDSPDSP